MNQVSLTFWMETNYFLQIKDFIVYSYHFQLLIIDCSHQVLIVKKRSLNYLLYFGIFMIDMIPIQFIEDCFLLLPEEPYFVIIFNYHSFHYFNWLIHPFNFKILVLDSEFVDAINERSSAARTAAGYLPHTTVDRYDRAVPACWDTTCLPCWKIVNRRLYSPY